MSKIQEMLPILNVTEVYKKGYLTGPIFRFEKNLSISPAYFGPLLHHACLSEVPQLLSIASSVLPFVFAFIFSQSSGH